MERGEGRLSVGDSMIFFARGVVASNSGDIARQTLCAPANERRRYCMAF